MSGTWTPGEPFPVARYRLHSVTRRGFEFADFAGSALHGAFGHALKAAVCVTRAPDCRACPLLRNCAYPALFKPPPPITARRVYTGIPAPLVVEPPPPGPLACRPGDPFEFELVLIGPALQHLSLVLATWRRALARDLGRQGQAHLKRVTDDRGEVVLALPNGRLQAHVQQVCTPPPPPRLEALKLQFLTPLQMQRKGQPRSTTSLQPADLLMALVRRTAAFVEMHLGMTVGADFTGLRTAAERIDGQATWQHHRWQRYSSRQGRSMPLGGVTGTWALQGDLTPFWPFLHLGQWLHVGKRCSFGLGRYRLRLPT